MTRLAVCGRLGDASLLSPMNRGSYRGENDEVEKGRESV